MKNVKAFGLLLMAIALGLAAAVYANNWIGQHTNVAANSVRRLNWNQRRIRLGLTTAGFAEGMVIS